MGTLPTFDTPAGRMKRSCRLPSVAFVGYKTILTLLSPRRLMPGSFSPGLPSDQTTRIHHFSSTPTSFRHYSNGVDNLSLSFLCPINGPQIALDESLSSIYSGHFPVVGDLCQAGVVQISSSPKAPEVKFQLSQVRKNMFTFAFSTPFSPYSMSFLLQTHRS